MPRLTRTRIAAYGAVGVILAVAIVGALLVIVHASNAGLAVFELITFSVGIAALLLAVTGSVSAGYQMRMTKRIAKELRTAIDELKGIDKTTAAIRRRLDPDYELAKDIAEGLQEAGMFGDDDAQRHEIASKIEHKVRARAKQDI